VSGFAIETEALTKRYGKLTAVDEIAIHAPRGGVYGFLGRNGAGKTSTLKMLLGLARATSGEARVLGYDVRTQMQEILKRTAFVSEKKLLYPWLTGAEIVRFTKGFYPQWSDAMAAECASALELPMDRKFGKQSNGNQTKLWLTLALAQQAELLILDEPSTALDAVAVDRMLKLLGREVAERGATIFFSSHQLEEVEQLADHVGVIDHGKLMFEAPLDEIKSACRMIVAQGEGLPTSKSEAMISVRSEGGFCRYVLRSGGEEFVAELTREGAKVLSVEALGLHEIFLHTVGGAQ